MSVLGRFVRALIALGLVAMVTVAMVTVAEARKYDDIIASGYIEFAVYSDFPPYSFKTGDEPRGIDIDLGQRIAKAMKLEPRWLWISADETVDDDLRNAIWKGHIVTRHVADVMLRVPYDRQYSYAMDGYGLPRNDKVVMMAPYHAESWRIVRDLHKVGDVRNLAIFQYQLIGVEIDTLPDFFLSGAYRGRLRDNVHHYPTIFLALDDFSRGRLSAVAGLRSQLEWGLGDNKPDFVDVDSDGLESMGRLEWDIGIAVKHDYRQLGYALEAVIMDLIRDGSLKTIFQRYHATYQLPALLAAEQVASE